MGRCTSNKWYGFWRSCELRCHSRKHPFQQIISSWNLVHFCGFHSVTPSTYMATSKFISMIWRASSHLQPRQFIPILWRKHHLFPECIISILYRSLIFGICPCPPPPAALKSQSLFDRYSKFIDFFSISQSIEISTAAIWSFLIRPCFAITSNKAQGQTLDKVGI